MTISGASNIKIKSEGVNITINSDKPVSITIENTKKSNGSIISKDLFKSEEIQRGIVPALKPAGITAGIAGLGSIATAAVIISKEGLSKGELLTASGRLGLVTVGAAATAGIVSNITSNKITGTAIGTGIGTVAGIATFAPLISEFGTKGILPGVAVFAGIGAISGFIGSAAATKK